MASGNPPLPCRRLSPLIPVGLRSRPPREAKRPALAGLCYRSGRQDLNLRPPGPQPERSRRTRCSSAVSSGLSRSELGSIALNWIPVLIPVRGRSSTPTARDTGTPPSRATDRARRPAREPVTTGTHARTCAARGRPRPRLLRAQDRAMARPGRASRRRGFRAWSLEDALAFLSDRWEHGEVDDLASTWAFSGSWPAAGSARRRSRAQALVTSRSAALRMPPRALCARS